MPETRTERSMTDAERWAFEQAIVYFAGPLAEARARRPKADGFRTLLYAERERAIHEVGHAVAAAVVGYHVLELSIVPNETRRTPNGQFHSGGFCSAAASEDAEESQPTKTVTRDSTQIVALAWLMTPCEGNSRPSWKALRRTVRQFRQTAESIIGQHWLMILALASELERKKTMNRAEIQRYVRVKANR